MAAWGPFYASHGFVLVIVSTTGADQPQQRAVKLVAAIEELKGENDKSDSPLAGKLSDRYGTSGYSMGGGGTVIASTGDVMLRTSIGLAPFGGSGAEVKAATLLLCGTADGTAPCNMSERVYGAIPDTLPKMMISISGATHFSWFGPDAAGMGTSGKYALAFQKVFLDGDERWKPLLTMPPTGAMMETNVK
jgi:predicted dienelactone hydrolase